MKFRGGIEPVDETSGDVGQRQFVALLARNFDAMRLDNGSRFKQRPHIRSCVSVDEIRRLLRDASRKCVER